MSYSFSNGFRLVLPHIDRIKYRMKGAWVGKEAEEILKESLSFLPHSHLQCAFTFKHILVDGTPVDPSFRPSLGHTIEYIFHRHEPEVLDDPIPLLYCDERFVVVNKPNSIPVHPIGRFKGWFVGPQKNSMIEIIREEHPELLTDGKEIKVVHRLDRLVSGVLILARSTEAAAQLQEHLKQQLVEKEYLARVKGRFPEGRVEVCQPITNLQQNPPLYGVTNQDLSAEGKTKSAHTIFEREDVSPDGIESIVRCKPVTGRSHQIRVHLQWLGHPIVNDYKYGGSLEISRVPEFVPEPTDYTRVDWCPECREGKRDTSRVAQEDLSIKAISLHALCYTNTHLTAGWKFEAPRPSWARFRFQHKS